MVRCGGSRAGQGISYKPKLTAAAFVRRERSLHWEMMLVQTHKVVLRWKSTECGKVWNIMLRSTYNYFNPFYSVERKENHVSKDLAPLPPFAQCTCQMEVMCSGVRIEERKVAWGVQGLLWIISRGNKDPEQESVF